jgi:hypothetical protein
MRHRLSSQQRCRCPPIRRSFSLAACLFSRCWRQPMRRARSYCRWSSRSLSNFCFRQSCSYWSACAFPGIATLLLIIVLFGTIVGLGAAISGPAGAWAAKQGLLNIPLPVWDYPRQSPSQHAARLCAALPLPPLFSRTIWLIYHTTDYIFESPSDLVSALDSGAFQDLGR